MDECRSEVAGMCNILVCGCLSQYILLKVRGLQKAPVKPCTVGEHARPSHNAIGSTHIQDGDPFEALAS